MSPIPPIAPDASEVPGEAEPEAPSGNRVAIKCAAKDCKFNKGGMCSKPEISVSAGPDPKCESYEPGAGGKVPAPPMPFMMNKMGA